MSSHSTTSFGVFLAAAVILALTPGQGFLYVLSRTLSGGWRHGVVSTLGTSVGGLVHGLVAAVGLSAVLAASAPAFATVKYVGAAYLLFLGVRTLLTAPTSHANLAAVPQSRGLRRTFSEGILTEILNVKTALFFLAFVPQFVNRHVPVAPQFIFLGLVCVTLNSAVDLTVVFLAARLKRHLQASQRPARMMSVGSGSVMIGLSAYIVVSGNKH